MQDDLRAFTSRRLTHELTTCNRSLVSMATTSETLHLELMRDTNPRFHRLAVGSWQQLTDTDHVLLGQTATSRLFHLGQDQTV